MKHVFGLLGLAALFATVVCLWNVSRRASAADAAAAPKIAAIAPAADLAKQLDLTVADLDKAVADKTEYEGQVDNRFVRDGAMIALLATALGMDEQENAIKPHAAAVVAAARRLGAAQGYDATKQAVKDLKTAIQNGTAGPLKYDKFATLEILMNNEVASLNSKLTNATRHLKRKDNAAVAAASATTLALIAENAKLYAADTKKPGESAKWAELAEQLHASAAGVAEMARKGDESGTTAAMTKLTRSCHDCHAVFNP